MTRKDTDNMRRATMHVLMAALVGTRVLTLAGDGDSALPERYALAEVSFEYAEGAGQEGTLVRVDGTGKGIVRNFFALKEDEVSTFAISSQEVLKLLELCYRESFFDLKSLYGPPNHIRMGADGMIDTLTTVVSHAVRRSVTIRIGQYSKSVSYLPGHGNPPPVVTELARRIAQLRDTTKADTHVGRSSNYPISPAPSGVTARAYRSTRLAAGRAGYRVR